MVISKGVVETGYRSRGKPHGDLYPPTAEKLTILINARTAGGLPTNGLDVSAGRPTRPEHVPIALFDILVDLYDASAGTGQLSLAKVSVTGERKGTLFVDLVEQNVTSRRLAHSMPLRPRAALAQTESASWH
ncbi:hypothetical protein C8Q74DRAFT_701047 [Fomes fomentarius]|nr:hypothetical protein C8Q74DRAFT_701047 [Fomes fomentarius]